MSEANGHVKRPSDTPFVMIPLAIARDEALSSGAKLLFGAIFSLSHLPDGCHCTNAGLGARIGVSKRHIIRLLKELESHLLISRKTQHREASIISVLWKARAIKISDKMSPAKAKGDKMSPKLGCQVVSDKMSPKEEERRNFEPNGSKIPATKKKPPNARPGDASAVQKEEDPESLGPRLTDEEYAAKLLATLRRQAWVNGKPPDYRWDPTSKIWRFNGPDWLLPLLQSVQAQVLAILDGERAAKESKP